MCHMKYAFVFQEKKKHNLKLNFEYSVSLVLQIHHLEDI